MTSVERPVSQVLGDIVGNVQQIVRAELRLAKAELREDAVLMKRTAMLAAVAAIAGTVALALFCLAAVYALALAVPPWAAALLVGVALFFVAMFSVMTARRHIAGVGMPRTTASLQENVQWVKTHVEKRTRFAPSATRSVETCRRSNTRPRR